MYIKKRSIHSSAKTFDTYSQASFDPKAAYSFSSAAHKTYVIHRVTCLT